MSLLVEGVLLLLYVFSSVSAGLFRDAKMPYSQTTAKFRTPYREKNALSSQQGQSEDPTVNKKCTNGDMLDLIGRSQSSSQLQYDQQSQKSSQLQHDQRSQTSNGLQRDQIQLDTRSNGSADQIPDQPLTKTSSKLKRTTKPTRGVHYPTESTPLVDRNPAVAAQEKRFKHLQSSIRPDPPSSEVYNFPDSPSKVKNRHNFRQQRRWHIERQVLRTIERMTKEIEYFRLRLRELKRNQQEFN